MTGPHVGDGDGKLPPPPSQFVRPEAQVSFQQGRSSGAGPEPQYAPAVDPWGSEPLLPPAGTPTTSWLASTLPEPQSGRLPVYRRKVFWFVAASLVLVVGAAAALVVVFWPGVKPIGFEALSDPKQIAPVVPIAAGLVATRIGNDQIYFASESTDNGNLGVVSTGLDGTEKWKTLVPGAKPAGGSVTQWEEIYAIPAGLVALTKVDSDTNRVRVVVLSAGDGKVRWDSTLPKDDPFYLVGDMLLVANKEGKRLIAYRLDGPVAEAWSLPDLPDGYLTPVLVVSRTPEDLAIPSDVEGRPRMGTNDDVQVVQISADRSARLIDLGKGTVIGQPRPSVAGPSDDVIAFNGRLFVWESRDTHRIVSYDLTKLGEPTSLYTVPKDNDIKEMKPCGDDSICWIESTRYDTETHQVAGIDVTEGGAPWHQALPKADTLIPVGDHVLAVQQGSPDTVTLFDAAGKGAKRWGPRPGVGARLDAGNVLLFSKSLSASPDDPAVSGAPVGGAVVPLGNLVEVRSSSCSWNTSTLACAGDQSFQLQTFAG